MIVGQTQERTEKHTVKLDSGRHVTRPNQRISTGRSQNLGARLPLSLQDENFITEKYS